MAYTNGNGQTRVGVRIVPLSVVIPTISTLLDSYSGAAAAYSLRKLNSSYTGSAIRVRRSSDNTEMNIGFDSNGNLDTYSLSAFVGTGNGFVTTWYDQSGNGQHAVQTIASNQPYIVNAGVVNTYNSKPCVKFDGVDDFIQSPYATGTSNELYFVTQTTDTGFLFPRGYHGQGFIAEQGSTNTETSSYWTTQPQLYVNSTLRSPANRNDVYNLLNGYKLSLHKGANISNNWFYLRFGSFIQNGYLDFNGNLFEWVIYPTLQSSQSSIESNINSYYSIYPNPTSVWNLLTAVYSADTTALPSLKTSLVSSYNGESNTNDSFGTNNGTAQGGLTYTTGKIGDAFQFNGSTSYVSLPTSSLQLTTFSINFWLYNPGNSSKTIAANLGNDGQNKGWYLDLTNGPTIRFVAWNNGTNIIGLNATGNPGYLNRWSMATLTVNGTSVKMYLDGSLVNSGNMSNTINYTTTTYPLIGGYRINNGAVSSILANNTRLDAFNVWQKELTASEVSELYNSGNGAQYIGNDFYKPTTNDALGTNNGTAVGGLTYGLGKVGTAFQFNGTNAYVDYGDNFDLGLSSWSYSFWTIPTSLIGERTFFSKSVAGPMDGRFFAFAYHDFFKVGMQVATIGGVPNIIEVISTNVIPTSWTMMTIVFDRSDKIKCYFNGNQIAMTTLTGTNNLLPYSAINYNTSAPFRIGAYTAFDGVTPMLFAQNKMDAFNIWNRALTQSEITELYNSGNGKQYPN